MLAFLMADLMAELLGVTQVVCLDELMVEVTVELLACGKVEYSVDTKVELLVY